MASCNSSSKATPDSSRDPPAGTDWACDETVLQLILMFWRWWYSLSSNWWYSLSSNNQISLVPRWLFCTRHCSRRVVSSGRRDRLKTQFVTYRVSRKKWLIWFFVTKIETRPRKTTTQNLLKIVGSVLDQRLSEKYIDPVKQCFCSGAV